MSFCLRRSWVISVCRLFDFLSISEKDGLWNAVDCIIGAHG